MHRLEPTSRPPALPDWLVRRRVVGAVVAPLALLAAPAGCETPTSATALNPEGPAMIRQVMVQEAYLNPNGQRVVARRIAFGTHPDAAEGDVKHVETALADNMQKIRVVLDELLVGNFLEEIACRGAVDEDAYTEVPVGATPDDIAKCAVALDILPETCVGDLAVCVGANPAMPVGVLDEDEDGTSDDTRFIRGAVRLVCAGIDVPLNIDQTYWQPSGTQLPPAQGGLDALGPAVVLQPERGLPTGAECTVVFSDRVVDKTGNGVCAPEDGDIANECEPGDTTKVSFETEPLAVTGVFPRDGAANVSLLAPGQTYSQFSVSFQVPIDGQTLDTATIEPAIPFTVVPSGDEGTDWVLRFDGGYDAGTEYTVTVPTTVLDTFGQPLGEAITVTFTTAA
jgi:hypothetical protein